MFKLYESTTNLLISQIKLRGSADHASVEASRVVRIKHFRDSIPSMPRCVEDSEKIMLALCSDTPAFNQDQRNELGDIVVTHMNNDSITCTLGTAVGHAKSQNNMFLFNYMPDRSWKKWRALDVSWDLKLEDSTDFLLDIGCANPDVKTYKIILSILMNLNDKQFAPQECYDQIWKLKEKLVENGLTRKPRKR